MSATVINTRVLAGLVRFFAIGLMAFVAAASTAMTRDAAAVLPPGNTVVQWNKIAEDTVVGSGAFQGEGFLYMAYASAAVYDAVVAIESGYKPYGPARSAPAGASVDAAVVEAAYRTLWAYFPPSSCNPASPPAAYAFCLGIRPRLDELYAEALSGIPDGQAKTDGKTVGLQAANDIIALRSGDNRMTPIGVTSSFPTLPPGPGVWRLTPPFAAPQTPWLGNVRRFLLPSVDRFLPDPPPSLQSDEWAEAFNQIKAYGAATGSVRSADQTAVAWFWSANVVRQYNGVGRDLAAPRGLRARETARLMAMINLVAADALMSGLYAKYHYLFWRPVTAIDPTAVTADGFGPVPGYDDGNPATLEQAGWRPLLTTPNHPEYPAAHGVITSAMTEVFTKFLGTNQIELDIHGFDATGPAGNLNAVRHFAMPRDLRHEIINARLWAGLHYHFSGIAGVVLGRTVAKYDLRHAFQPEH
ncbi:MAG TPA: vanadium-dependent haloperoxidase [Gaiellaceae bacterium]|nr:vanadium-dependent haloperoxidase [Gaiellaceae bacterium]